MGDGEGAGGGAACMRRGSSRSKVGDYSRPILQQHQTHADRRFYVQLSTTGAPSGSGQAESSSIYSLFPQRLTCWKQAAEIIQRGQEGIGGGQPVPRLDNAALILLSGVAP